ncbi:MAG: type III pantothenate kinase [Coriobacteriaceae bacterium]|nr:type III pantothenate kinase [Coriobacteriaceae bacterium]
MLLAADIGNTQTVLGLYAQGTLLHLWRMATNKTHTADELRVKLLALLAADATDASQVDGFVLASVVPRLTASWVEAARGLFGCEALNVNARTAALLFKTDYHDPEEIGADRIADAVAAVSLYGAPVVVVDFGTATNIEVIDRRGVFVGGVIAPGMETSAFALFSHAARLSAIDLIDPHTAIGGNTAQAVQAGIVYGEVERVDGLVRRIFAQLGYEPPVIATGGLAPAVARLSTTIGTINPELTLEGLRLVFEAQAPERH